MLPDELTGLFTHQREAVLAKIEAVSSGLGGLSSSFQKLPATAPADQPRALRAARESLHDFRSGIWTDFKNLFRRPNRRTAEGFAKIEAVLQGQEARLAAAIETGVCDELNRTGFEVAQRVLEEFKEAQRSKQRLFKSGIFLLCAIPGILGYFIWAYYRLSSSSGLQVKETFVAAPPAAFAQNRSGAFAMDENYRRQWFEQFSRYYFGRKVTDPELLFSNTKVNVPLFAADNFDEGHAGLVDDFVEADNPKADFLWKRCSPETQQALKNAKENGGSDERFQALANAFNRIMQGSSLFYTGGLVDDSEFSPELQALLAQKPAGEGLLRLNRLLLAEAFKVPLRPETHASHMNFDVVVQNSARAAAVPLAGLAIRLGFAKKRPFPWELVDTSVHLEVDANEYSVTLTNTGIGKLRSFACQGRFHSAVVFSAHAELLNGDKLDDTIEINNSEEPDESADFGVATTRENEEIIPVYRRLDSGKETPPANTPIAGGEGPDDEASADKKPVFFGVLENNQQPLTYYETITTLPRLKEVTTVHTDRTVAYTFTYQSLKGETQSGKFTLDIARNRHFFETKGGSVSSVDPRNDPSLHGVATGPLSILAAVDTLLPVGESNAKADDLIVQNFAIPAGGLNEGGGRTVAAIPEKILQPGGLLLVHTSVSELATGDYTLSLHANGHALAGMPIRFSALVPPSWKFHPKDAVFFDPKYSKEADK